MTVLTEFLAMGGYAFYVWSAFGLSFLLIVSILVWSSHEHKRVTRESFAIALRERDRKLKRDQDRNVTEDVTPSQVNR